MDRGKVLVRHSNGKPLRAVGTSLDTTHKRKAEDKVRFEAQLLALLDEGVISLSKDFTVRSWSAGAEKIFNLDSSTVLGLKLPQVLSIKHYENQMGYSLGHLGDLKEGWKGEVIVNIKNGQTYRIFITFTPIKDQEEGGYILVCKDIEEISAIQHRLIEQQSYVVSAIENSADAIFALNEKHELLYFNSAFRQVSQQLGKEMNIGDTVFDMVADEVKNQLEQNWQIVSKGERFSYEYQYAIDNLLLQFYEIFVNPIYGPNEGIIGISYLCRNITESKKAADQLHTMQLEILNTKLQAQFIQSNSILEGQELERKRLGRELHDGLGQMLNVLKMRLVRETSSMEARQTVDHIIAEVIRLNNNLMPLVLQDFGLHAGIRQLIGQYEQLTEAKFYFFSDSERERFDSKFEINVYRIVQEALSNAVKYANAKNISIQIIHNQNALLIMIEDDGIGFDRKVEQTNSGKGYGLFNMQFRVEALHGKMLIETDTGRGCVINIELPLEHE